MSHPAQVSAAAVKKAPPIAPSRAVARALKIEHLAITSLFQQRFAAIEKARIFALLLAPPLSRSVPTLAGEFKVSRVTIYNHLLLLKTLGPKVIDLMDPAVRGEHILQFTLGVSLGQFAHLPDVQLELAQEIVEHRLTLKQGKSRIQQKADELGITGGRGRQAKPVDHLRALMRMFDRVQTTLQRFGALDQSRLDSLLAPYAPETRAQWVASFREITAELSRTVEKLAQQDGGSDP